MLENAAPQRLRFGDYVADLQSRELFRGDTRVRLPNQSFEALAALLERPGQLVTREELRTRIWTDNRVVEFEQGLNAVINRLREALEDDAENARYVETLPRRGYRFVGSLETPAPSHPTDSAVRDDLAAPSSPEPLLPAAPGTSRRGPWMILLLAGAVLTVIAALVLWRRGGDSPAFATVTPLTTLVGEEQMVALSPDGKRIAFAWNGRSGDAPGFDLFVREIGSERLMQLTDSPATAIASAWSPDGTQLAYARHADQDGGLLLVAATGGEARKLADARFPQASLAQPAWSPDGRTIAYSALDTSGSQTLRLLTIDTANSVPLADAPSCWHAGAPAWIGDGAELAFICMTSIAVYEVYVAKPGTSSPSRRIAKLQGFPQGLAWADARERLLIANDAGDGGGIWELTLDGKLTRPAIVEDSLGPGVSAVNSRVAYSRARRTVEIWQASIDGSGFTHSKRLIYSTREQLTPRYSPDGARIAFQSNRSGSPEIWLADADGGNPVRVTSFNGPMTGAPAWCADGRRLAFDSRESGVSAIYIIDVFERVPRRVETSQANLALPVWSPDCHWLLASDGRAALYRVPAAGGAAQRVTEQRAYQAAVIGDRVIFNVAEPSGVVLWMSSRDGGEQPIAGVPRLAYAEAWTANDTGIYFTGTGSSETLVHRHDLATGSTAPVASLPNAPTPLGGLGLAVRHDGAALLWTHTADAQSDVVLVTSGAK